MLFQLIGTPSAAFRKVSWHSAAWSSSRWGVAAERTAYLFPNDQSLLTTHGVYFSILAGIVDLTVHVTSCPNTDKYLRAYQFKFSMYYIQEAVHMSTKSGNIGIVCSLTILIQ